MLFSLLYAVVYLSLEIVIIRGRSKAAIAAEVLALRHQPCARAPGRPPTLAACRSLRADGGVEPVEVLGVLGPDPARSELVGREHEIARRGALCAVCRPWGSDFCPPAPADQ